MARAARIAALALALACASARAPEDPALALAFDGPGRLAVIWHLGEPDDPLDRHLVVYDAKGAHALDVERPREVRWLAPDALLVAVEVPAGRPGEFATVKLLRVSPGDARSEQIAAPRRYYDAEPAPGGAAFVVGVEINDQGESQLELWSLAGERPERLARRDQNLDQPRWSPDGKSLAVAMMVEPNELEGDLALSVGGVYVPWPRLFTLEARLGGRLLPIHDGPRDGPPAAGGSLALWWDARGLHARQRDGIVRCRSPESGCALVFRSPGQRRLVDARPLGSGRALALLVDTASGELDPLPSEIWLLDLESGSGRALQPPARGAFPLDLDWSPAP